MEALRLQDCGQLAKDNEGSWWNDDTYMPLFYYIEAVSGCGGMCTGDIPLFGFPENPVTQKPVVDQTNKELLRHPCFHELANLLESNGDKVSASIIAFGLPILFSVCGACWIVCYPPPLARKGYIHPPYFAEGDGGFASSRYDDPAYFGGYDSEDAHADEVPLQSPAGTKYAFGNA